MGTTNSSPTARSFIESEIAAHQVVIWSKSWCGYCRRTINLFEGLRNDPTTPVKDMVVHQLDQALKGGVSGAEVQTELEKMTGQRTVPNVFVNGQHVGGSDDTIRAMKNGTLQKLLGLGDGGSRL